MRQRGKITGWNPARGYGFIVPRSGGDRVFLHVRALAPGQRRPVVLEMVTYEVVFDSQNRPRAVNVCYAGMARLPALPPRGTVSLILAAGFLLAAFTLAALQRVPQSVPVVYALMSGATALAYQADKNKARTGVWRTPEAALHLLALAGGWPGTLFAQHGFRHKTRKRAFGVTTLATALLHLAAWVWFLFLKGNL